MFTEQQLHWVMQGKMFGYPKCCIESFIELRHLKSGRIRKLNGTGFIPCATCNELKTEEQMIEQINKDRNPELEPFCANMLKFTVKWQSGTNEGTVLMSALNGHHAYQLASPALAAISKEKGLMYMNVTVEPKVE